MLLALCLKLSVADCPKIIEYSEHMDRGVIMSAIVTKSGTKYVAYNGKQTRRLPQFTIRQTLIHELAHHKAYEQYGTTIMPHGGKFKKICYSLALEAGEHPRLVCTKTL